MGGFILDLVRIFVTHLIPLVSVLYLKVDVANIVFIYWLESLLMNIFCHYKMKRLKEYCLKTGKIPHEDTVDDYFTTEGGSKPPVLRYEGKNHSRLPKPAQFDAFIGKLLFPNKLFLIGHGLILLYILGVGLKFNFSIQNLYVLGLSFLMLSVRQVFSYNAYSKDQNLLQESSFKQ